MGAIQLLAIALFAAIISATSANVNITSPPITDWGIWGSHQRCPFGRYAGGFQLRTEPNQLAGDDTALNTIRVFCGDPYRPDTAIITSTPGEFGDWGRVYNCFPGVLTGFQLRSESNRQSGDDTAANNIRFFCSSSSGYIEGDGMSWGDWTTAQRCYSNQGICAMQTQVEPYLDSGDDTMLNNVRFECCDMNLSPAEAAAAAAAHPQEKLQTVADLNIFPVKVIHAQQNTPELLVAIAKSNAERKAE